MNVNAIVNSHATGAVESIFYAGGLVGLNRGSITDTYATGDVNGREIVGGLVGDNRDSINNSYARGTVTGQRSVGALVGNQSGRHYPQFWYWSFRTYRSAVWRDDYE